MRSAFLLFLALWLASCTATQDKFTVRGEVKYLNAKDKTAYLIISDKVVDSSQISSEGLFEFTGDATALQPASVTIASSREISFYNEPGTINITYANGSLRISGTPLNDALQKLHDMISNFAHIDIPDFAPLSVQDSIRKAYHDKADRAARELFQANQDNVVGAITLLYWMQVLELPSAEVEKLLKTAGAVVCKDEDINNELMRRRREAATAVGRRFSDFEGTDTNGCKLRFSDFAGRGKWTLMYFWSSYHYPCIKSMKDLTTLQRELAAHDFEVFGVNIWDNREDAREAIARINMPWNNIIAPPEVDQDACATSVYGIDETSTLILIDPSGKIALRGQEFTFDDIKKLVTATK